MIRRYRLPAGHPSGVIDKLDLSEIIGSTWAKKALDDEAARVRGIALSVADAAVFAVAQVFAGHGLVDDVFDIHDNDALYGAISGIAARLVHERLIERLGDGRRDMSVRKEVSVSIFLRKYQEYVR